MVSEMLDTSDIGWLTLPDFDRVSDVLISSDSVRTNCNSLDIVSEMLDTSDGVLAVNAI